MSTELAAVATRTSPRKAAERQALLGEAETSERRVSNIRAEVADMLQKRPIKKPKDVIQFFSGITYKATGGQQLAGKCWFCTRTIQSTGAARLVDHLLQCALCIPEVKEACRTLREETSSKRKAKAEELGMVDREVEQQLAIAKAQKMELKQQGLRSSFKAAEVDIADHAIADFFYANGISFSAADTAVDSLYMQMVRAIQAAPAGYVPPERKKLSHQLLDSSYDHMWRSIKQRDPSGVLAEKFGIAYTQDGWDSVDHLPLINSAYITANDGGVYLRSVDTSGRTKDAVYIAALMIQDIYSIGCTNVILVVTDTCAVMQRAWEFVMDEFPWLSAIPCVPHVVSLLMKDVSKIEEVAALVKDETIVVGWFSNHQKPLAILREKVKSLMSRSCELVKAGATRFGTNTLVGERLLKLKNALQQTVVDPEYVKQGYKDGPEDMEQSNCETVTRQNKGATAKRLVLDDDESTGFWARVNRHVSATLPIYKLLRRHDSSAPSVGKVYHGFYSLGEHVKQSRVSYQEKLLDAHESRWCYGHCDFFAAAYALDPEYISHDVMSNTEVTEGLANTIEKLGILFEVRRLQKMDSRSATPSESPKPIHLQRPPTSSSSSTYTSLHPACEDAMPPFHGTGSLNTGRNGLR